MTLGGMQISARTRIHIPVFALHRNVRLWDNPTAFDPDRFAADKVKTRSRYAFCRSAAGRASASGRVSPPSRRR